MTFNRAAIAGILEAGRQRGDGGLRETEGLALAAAMGIAVPRGIEVAGSDALAGLQEPLPPGDHVVVKVVSPDISHKTDVQGVLIVPNRAEDVRSAIAEMEQRFERECVEGFIVQEFIEYDHAFGHELLMGMRWTDDFGPVVTVASGGIATEAMSAALRRDEALAVFSPDMEGNGTDRSLTRLAAVRQITESQRGQTPDIEIDHLSSLVGTFLAFAELFAPDPVIEFELNPLVLSNGRFVALDALVRFTGEMSRPAPPRPLEKIGRLLAPRSVAVMGVSEKMNPGRIILRNLLHDGVPREQITIVKPDRDEIDGCRCVPSLEALPERVDLLILSIAAAQVPDAIASIVDGERAESVILIPGGLDENPGGRHVVAGMREKLAMSRATPWRGPIINGGNCLGVRSVPGHYNTLFIPPAKMPTYDGPVSPVALISGSGAFTVSKISKLAGVNARYVVSIGNQMDLTLADYLEYLRDDPNIELFAVYSEGFRMLDGIRFMKAAAQITASGRTVVLYQGGRTSAGAAAAASHTAAISGDYEILRQLAASAGVLLAESLDDFEDYVRLFTSLADREVEGLSLGAVTNAGFESVAIADNLGRFSLAPLVPSTEDALGLVLDRARLGEIVTIRNPIDLTPIMSDADFEDIVRIVLLDPGVHVGLVGCVPMTGALNTLEAGPTHHDDVSAADSLASRLVSLRTLTRKPWVAVVDGGRLYDAMAQRIEDGGIPTFRTADRALRVLNVYATEMQRRARVREDSTESARNVQGESHSAPCAP